MGATCGKHNYTSIRIQYEELMNWGMLGVGLQEKVKPLGATYRGEVHILQVFLHRLYWAHKKRQVRPLKKSIPHGADLEENSGYGEGGRKPAWTFLLSPLWSKSFNLQVGEGNRHWHL